MVLAVSPTQDEVNTAVGNLIAAVAAVEIAVSQVNRVPEPKSNDFVVLTPIARRRLVTNIDSLLDSRFTGAIAGTTLSASLVTLGPIQRGAPVFGSNVTVGTSVVAQINGTPGGAGDYEVSPAQTVSSQTMAAGTRSILESSEIDIQIDVHGPNSAENAQIISTVWRDAYAVDFLQGQNQAISSFEADDARQAPFMNDQAQIETRYVLTGRLQVNFTVSLIPQQFAEQLRVSGFIAADVEYPAT